MLIQEMNVTFGRMQFYLQIERWKLLSSFVMGILKDLHISRNIIMHICRSYLGSAVYWELRFVKKFKEDDLSNYCQLYFVLFSFKKILEGLEN